jgi:predicted oxidoreductase
MSLRNTSCALAWLIVVSNNIAAVIKNRNRGLLFILVKMSDIKMQCENYFKLATFTVNN